MSHLLQGFLDKLLDRHDGLSKEVLRKAVFYVVPCANPDGEQVLPPGDGPVPDNWLPKTPCLGFTYEPGHCVIQQQQSGTVIHGHTSKIRYACWLSPGTSVSGKGGHRTLQISVQTI